MTERRRIRPFAGAPPTLPVAAFLALAGAAALGGCALLPGGSGTGPEEPTCSVRVHNDAEWGLKVFLRAPDGRPPVIFERELPYIERDGRHLTDIPCGYRSALVVGQVRRVSGLSGMQRTTFRTGICLIPGDTVVAVLDEYGSWEERWWEACPEPPEADSAGVGAAGRGAPRWSAAPLPVSPSASSSSSPAGGARPR